MSCFWLYKQIRQIREELRAIRFLVNPPRSITLKSIGENGMAIQFAVVLPVPPAGAADWAEIASGKLVVSIPGAEPFELATEKDVQETELRQVTDERFVGAQGDFVELTFSYIDDAGNEGAKVSSVTELTDTVPPVAPESIGLVATAEV